MSFESSAKKTIPQKKKHRGIPHQTNRFWDGGSGNNYAAHNYTHYGPAGAAAAGRRWPPCTLARHAAISNMLQRSWGTCKLMLQRSWGTRKDGNTEICREREANEQKHVYEHVYRHAYEHVYEYNNYIHYGPAGAAAAGRRWPPCKLARHAAELRIEHFSHLQGPTF